MRNIVQAALIANTGAPPKALIIRRAAPDLPGPDLEGARFDLVMACHVLEHLSDPAAQLEILFELVGASGALYVEVPLERPDLRWAGVWPWHRRGLSWLAGHRRLLTLVDLHSTWFRIRRNLVPPGGFLKASEHLNFFTTDSLRALMTRKGFQVLACEEMQFVGAFSRATALGCVARRAGATGTDPGDNC